MRNAMWVGGGITGMGEIPMLGVKEKGIAKVIRDIFRNGEKGFFYDPSDMGTLFQDSAGTAAVNDSGQPSGLVLDKSKGMALGPELVTNGDFSNGLIGWAAGTNASRDLSNGELVLTVSGPQYNTVNNAVFQTVRDHYAGKRYNIEFDATYISGGDLSVGIRNTAAIIVTPAQNAGQKRRYSFSLSDVSGLPSTSITFAAKDSLSSWSIDNVSCKQVLGNHTYQTTSAARPILQQTPILGSELVVNGDTSNGTDGWLTTNATLKIVDGAFVMTASSQYGGVTKNISLDTAKTYELTFTVRGNTTNATPLAAHIRPVSTVTNYAQVNITTEGEYKLTFKPTEVASRFMFQHGHVSPTGSLTFDNVSIKEITGYRTDQNYIKYDGVDDKLITNLPSALTNCTVLRAIPNVGTQVKYNQTLPMSYEDTANHSGLIAIDRALTRSEQLRLMTELDKKAGATSLETLAFRVFDNNQEGFVYDPNDLSTLYQDAAGSVPVTAVGQPVGLILDKSKGLMLGNELIPTLDFGTWVKTAAVTEVATNTFTTNAAGGCTLPIFGANNTKTYALSIKGRSTSGMIIRNGGLSILPLHIPAGEFNISLTHVAISSGGPSLYLVSTRTGTVTIDSISVREVLGNHAYQTTSASRPILRKNIVTGANYLEFDGSDDFLQTNNIDFTGTDKVSLFAGMQMKSVDSIGCLVNFGRYDTANKGIFHIRAPQDSGVVTASLYTIGSSTTRALAISNAVELGKNFVLSANSYTNPEKSVLKINGGDTIEHDSSDSTGNFGMYPLLIGRFGGTTHAFNGHVYSLIGIGKLVSDTETTAIEKALAKRTGVDLNV